MIITHYYAIITQTSVITHYYPFQSPELADDSGTPGKVHGWHASRRACVIALMMAEAARFAFFPCLTTRCVKMRGQSVPQPGPVRPGPAAARQPVAPRVDRWRRHALLGCKNGTLHPMTAAARIARQQVLTDWRRCQASPGGGGKPCPAARASDGAGPRVSSELIVATKIQHTHIHDQIRD